MRIKRGFPFIYAISLKLYVQFTLSFGRQIMGCVDRGNRLALREQCFVQAWRPGLGGLHA